MTGEITLRGKVLPVGGIKEKILAAKRAGIKEIILCDENRKNIEEIQPMYLKGLDFHYVSDIKEVLDLALTDETVNDAIDFCGEIRIAVYGSENECACRIDNDRSWSDRNSYLHAGRNIGNSERCAFA